MSILTKIRNLRQDNLVSGTDIFTYANSSTFSLSEANISSVTDVYRNDVASGVSHTYSSTSNKVTITSALTVGDTVQVDYQYYEYNSDTELKAYIQAALTHIAINGYTTFEYDTTEDEVYPCPTEKEEYIIALIASILIDPDNRSIRLPDVSIGVPNDMPTDEKITRTIAKFKHGSHGIFDLLG